MRRSLWPSNCATVWMSAPEHAQPRGRTMPHVVQAEVLNLCMGRTYSGTPHRGAGADPAGRHGRWLYAAAGFVGINSHSTASANKRFKIFNSRATLPADTFPRRSVMKVGTSARRITASFREPKAALKCVSITPRAAHQPQESNGPVDASGSARRRSGTNPLTKVPCRTRGPAQPSEVLTPGLHAPDGVCAHPKVAPKRTRIACAFDSARWA